MTPPPEAPVSPAKIVQAIVWLAIWIGGLWFANRRYGACLDHGVMLPGCNRTLENLGWGAALFGLIMLARTLHSIPILRRWLGD